MSTVTTLEILARRALNLPCGQECVDWAIDMLLMDVDTPHLRQLAGAIAPFSTFELSQMRDRALEELGAPAVAPADAPIVFARERLRLALDGKADLVDEVYEIAQLSLGLDRRLLFDFELLWWAYQDLEVEDTQHYWEGADRTNILDIMASKAREFILRHEPPRAPDHPAPLPGPSIS